MQPLEPGAHLGAFEIVRPLDAGGMGMVNEAVHTTLGRRCAVKVFATESQRQDFLRRRFLAEGRLLAEFRHPRIVHVTDLQIDALSGTPYFAMDLVLSPDGTPKTLEDMRKRGVDEDQVVGWLRDVCEGLDYIHARGVVHRDISRENVMVGPDGHAVITDFGISRIFDSDLRQRVDLTRFTMVELGTTELKMGKVPYMAPELMRPRPAHATPASDAWALGVLLFRLLTGFWFEREHHANCMDMLAGMKYDWSALLVRLLDDRPGERLPEQGGRRPSRHAETRAHRTFARTAADLGAGWADPRRRCGRRSLESHATRARPFRQPPARPTGLRDDRRPPVPQADSRRAPCARGPGKCYYVRRFTRTRES